MGTQIAQTASISLITAPPGSGKTLRAVMFMEQALKDGTQVFACNVNGLTLDGVIDFPDPTKWQELPAGSLLVVDECQKFFRAAAGQVPDYIKEMETIRHGGIRLLLLTQHPALIHANIRALVGYHEHLVRENGKASAIVYNRSRVIDNVRSDKALAVEDHHTWAYPKHVYDLYKSAEVHTVKRTIPNRHKRAIVLFVVAAALFGFTAWRIKSGMTPAEKEQAGREAARPTAPTGPPGEKPAITSAGAYAQAVQPMIEDAPFTAPGFVNRPFVSDPVAYCMSSGHMKGKIWVVDSCTCLTEQGTRYQVEMTLCGERSKNGPRYNPYKAPTMIAQDANRTPEPETPETGVGQSPTMTAPAALPSGQSSYARPPEYGAIAVGQR